MFDNDRPPNKSPATEGIENKRPKKGVQIVADGLRYKSKPAGSPFAKIAGNFGSTMSCYKCGKHRPSSDLDTKKFLGKSQKVCKGGCVK